MQHPGLFLEMIQDLVLALVVVPTVNIFYEIARLSIPKFNSYDSSLDEQLILSKVSAQCATHKLSNVIY